MIDQIYLIQIEPAHYQDQSGLLNKLYLLMKRYIDRIRPIRTV